MVSVYPEGAPGRHGLISIEATTNVVPPGPNYVFLRIGELSLFIPNISVDEGALAEPLPHPLGVGADPQEQPPLRVSQLQLPPAEKMTIIGWRLLEILNGGPEMRDKHYGRFVRLLRGRMIWGVHRKWWFAATCYMYLAFLCNTTFMDEIFKKHFGRLAAKAIHIMGGILGLFTISTFFILGLTDPGVVPKNYTLRELLAETGEYRARHPNQRYYSYCSECRTCRPPRTFHCPTCDICIRGRDSHLMAAGTCVGERNRRSYFFHVISQTLYGTFMLGTSVIIAIHIIQGSTTSTRELIHLIVSGVGGIVLLFILEHGTIFKLVSRFYLLYVGRTTTEEYRRRLGLDANDCFVERLSVGGNVRNFFCRKSMPSVFRKIDDMYESDAWILEQWPLERPTVEMQELREFIQNQMEEFENGIADANVE